MEKSNSHRSPESLQPINKVCLSKRDLGGLLSKLTYICSTAEHCSYEMQEKMQKWSVPETMQHEALEYLQKEKYIDDERFCRFFVREKLRFNKWGRLKIEQALWLKHIDKQMANSILDEITDEEYLEILQPLLVAKKKSVKAKSEYELKQKLMRFAYSRGFTIDLIEKALTPNP